MTHDNNAVPGAITVQPDQILILDGSTATRAIVNDGVVECGAHDAETLGGSITGGGLISLDARSRLYLNAPVIDARQTIRFDGPNAMIVLEPGCDRLPVIDGFEAGDGIQLAQNAVDMQAGTDADGNATVAVTLLDGSVASFTFDGDFAGRQFYLDNQRLGAGPPVLRVTDAVACYCPGTLIATEGGEVPIERLRIGDQVLTADSGLQPIVWIGHRRYDLRFAAGRRHMLPVRIDTGALGNGLPRRPLLVSPRHALLLDGVLIPAGLLINDRSVTQPEATADIAYLHIELDGHHLLLAEGAAAESFADDDSRGMFHNADEYRRLHPDRPPSRPVWCAPLVEHGPALQAARRRIDLLSGMSSGADAGSGATPLLGQVDEVLPGYLRGWAWCATHPQASVCLEVLADGLPVRLLLADRLRPDLLAAGIGSGCHGFEAALPDVAAGATLSVRRALDHMPLASAC